MKRKKKILGEGMNIRIEENCLRIVREHAEREQRTVAGQIRTIIDGWIARTGIDKETKNEH
jgi:hypothetical protein